MEHKPIVIIIAAQIESYTPLGIDTSQVPAKMVNWIRIT